MLGIQEFIYSLEVGNLRAWLVRLGVLVLLAGLGVFYFVKQFNGLKHQESMDVAQLSRQIARGEGYTTKFLRPAQLREMDAREAVLEQVPDLVHPPVYPFLNAGLFKVAGANFVVDTERLRDFSAFAPERLMVLMNLLLVMLATVLLYLWMLRAFDSRVAATAAILYAVTDLVWAHAIWGFPTALLMATICFIGFVINEALISEENDGFGLALFWFFLASAATGVLSLTSYSMIVFWPVLIGLGALAFHRRWLMIAVAGVVPFLIIAPWLYRNFELSGHPFGLSWMEIFVDNGKFPGNSLWRIYDLNGSVGGLKPLLRAMALGVSHVLENLGSFMGGLVPVALALGGCFHMFRRHRCQASRWFWMGAVLLLLIFNGALIKEREIVGHQGLNLMLAALPVFCGFGAAFAFILLDRLRLPSMILAIPIIGLLCAIQAAPMGLRIAQKPAPPFAYPPYFPPMLFLVKNWIEPNEVVCSDIPWAMAWYSDRRCVWLPNERDEFFSLSDFQVNIVAILLTPESQKGELYTQIEAGAYKDWADVITRRDFKNLPLPSVTVLPPNNDDYFIMADRARWKEAN